MIQNYNEAGAGVRVDGDAMVGSITACGGGMLGTSMLPNLGGAVLLMNSVRTGRTADTNFKAVEGTR